MNIKDFSQPTILKATQYGTTITIELDHSDTSIDEVMDGMLTIVKGLGYLDSTINEWIKDKSKDIYDDEYEIMKDSLADDWFDETINNEYDEYDNEEVDWKGWDEDTNRMDVIGQNGNEGLHYDTDMGEDYDGQFDEWNNETPTENEWGSEPEEEDGIVWTDEDDEKYGYKGIVVEHPHFDWDNETNDILEAVQRSITLINERLTDIETELEYNNQSLLPNEALQQAAKRYSEEVKQKHVKIEDFDVVDWETGEVSYDNDGGFANNKLDKTKVVKGKIEDLKKNIKKTPKSNTKKGTK